MIGTQTMTKLTDLIWTGKRFATYPPRMFCDDDGKVTISPVHDQFSGMQSIVFGDNEKVVCAYCGHEYDGIECPGCSARTSLGNVFHAGVANVHMAGLMPHSEWLTNPPSQIDICVIMCGDPSKYTNASSIIHLRNCTLVMSEIENDFTPWVSDCEIRISSIIKCVVSIEHCLDVI